MRLDFTKMHGLGNDFVVVDAWEAVPALSAVQRRHLARRRTGVGCDQLLVLRPAAGDGADYAYDIYNADGKPAGQCGNGARCLARYAADRGYAGPRQRARTAVGEVALELHDDGTVTADMGPPRLDPGDIPFVHRTREVRYELDVGGRECRVAAVSMGNPHAVLAVDAVASAPVHDLGPRIETHPRFPEHANVGFMEIVTPRHIRLRVWERGAGETPACGTGACAAAVAGRLAGELDETVAVSLPGGDLEVRWAGGDAPVLLRGPAEYCYTGTVEL